MSIKLIKHGIILAALTSMLGQAFAGKLTADEIAKGWKLLFDGKTFNGWRNYKAEGVREGWKIEDGVMIHTKKGGDIMTVKQYENFELKTE